MSRLLESEIIRLQGKLASQIKGVQKNAITKKTHQKRMRQILSLAEQNGIIETLWKGNRLEAAIMIFDDPLGLNGTAVKMVHICDNLSSARAWNWIKRNLMKYRDLFDENTVISLPGFRKRRLNFFEQLGFHIHSLIQLGIPQIALKKLGGGNSHSVNHFMDAFDTHNLKCERLSNLKDVKTSMAIFKNFFSNHPEYCFFATDPSYLKAYENELKQHAKSKKGTYFVIKSLRGKVKGFFGINIYKDPLFGKCAGLEFVFSKEIQGQGLSKLAYRVLLKEMIDHKVCIFKGGTSQPAVIKLGKRMERWTMAYLLKFGKPEFEREHFFDGK